MDSTSSIPAGRPRLYGLILAAGYSSRMGGRPKSLLRLGRESLLAMSVNALRAGGLERVLVVTGHESARVSEEAQSLKTEALFNPDFDKGMFSSLCAAFSRLAEEFVALPDDAPAGLLVLPVDAPLVAPWTVSRVAAYWRALAAQKPSLARSAVLIPCFSGRGGHPPLLGAKHVAGVLARKDELACGGGLRAYLASLLREDCREVFLDGQVPDSSKDLGEGRQEGPDMEWSGAESLLPCPPLHAGKPGHVFDFLPLPDAGVLADLDRPEDLAGAGDFLGLTRERTLPGPEEAWQWLSHSGNSEAKIRHSILVALGALRLGRALASAGKDVDLLLHCAGGLLHDLTRKCSLKDKKCKAHARRGMDMLMDRGWRECALVVGAHTVLPDSMLAALGLDCKDVQVRCRMRPGCEGAERDALVFSAAPSHTDPHAGASQPLLHACMAVYLADKYFFMDRFVSLDERFGIVLDRFQGDEEAVSAISHRKMVAYAVRDWFYAASGHMPEALLRRGEGTFSSPVHTVGPADERLKSWEELLTGLVRSMAL